MAKKLVVPATVTIYNRKGKPETHSRANARDLVNGAGYSWEKKGESNPAAYAPFAIPQNTQFAKSKAQEVLDRAVPTRGDDEGEEIFEGVVDEGDTGPVTPEEIPDEVEEEAAPAPRPRRQRTSRKKTPQPEEDEIVDSIEEE